MVAQSVIARASSNMRSQLIYLRPTSQDCTHSISHKPSHIHNSQPPTTFHLIMSGSYGQQNRTTESWNSDPNSFSNPSGPDAGFQNQPGGTHLHCPLLRRALC